MNRGALLQFCMTFDKLQNITTVQEYILQAREVGELLCILTECWNSPYTTTEFAEYTKILPDAGKNDLSCCHLCCNMTTTSMTIETAIPSAIMCHKRPLSQPQSNSTPHAQCQHQITSVGPLFHDDDNKLIYRIFIQGILKSTKNLSNAIFSGLLRCSNFPFDCLLQIHISIWLDVLLLVDNSQWY